MSVQATSWVWEHSQAEGVARLVALAVADAANKEGRRSCQAVSSIARMVKASERTVQRALRELEAAGEIAATGKDAKYRTTVYAFPGVTGIAGVREEPGEGDTNAPVGDTGSTARVTNGAAVGDTAMTPYPSTTPTTTPPPSDADADAPDGKPAREVVDWWWNGLPIKPARKEAYIAAVKMVEALMRQGNDRRSIASALRECGRTPSLSRLEYLLDRMGGSTGSANGGRSGTIDGKATGTIRAEQALAAGERVQALLDAQRRQQAHSVIQGEVL